MNLYEEKLSGFFGLPICREYRVRQRKKQNILCRKICKNQILMSDALPLQR